jgi:hypothetical protein
MAKIPEYIAAKTELRPSDLGFQAFETEGRRVGGMYREAANDMITGAKLAGEMAARDIEWPYIMQSLQGGASSGGTNIKAVGGSSGADSAFPFQRMPDLSAEDAAAAGALPDGSSTLPGAAARAAQLTPLDKLTNALKGLMASAPVPAPAPGPNAAAEDAANAWGRTITGPVSTGADPNYGYSPNVQPDDGGGGGFWSSLGSNLANGARLFGEDITGAASEGAMY